MTTLHESPDSRSFDNQQNGNKAKELVSLCLAYLDEVTCWRLERWSVCCDVFSLWSFCFQLKMTASKAYNSSYDYYLQRIYNKEKGTVLGRDRKSWGTYRWRFCLHSYQSFDEGRVGVSRWNAVFFLSINCILQL